MDKYYVSGVKADAEGNCEIGADNEAHFFTLYERNETGESQAIEDLNSRADAEKLMAVYVERDALQQQVNSLSERAERLNGMFNNALEESARLQQQVNALAAEGAEACCMASTLPLHGWHRRWGSVLR
ncbi:hypothetical protein [Pantoea sp. BAV 3049]|uniref:hypothetical protein n=1 Tax=Pantoea sp. BAV 3049 TaxID=2654188 RepID=UPI00131BB277|nr:hypothetical protein [Pantoea sp. BAV 3049]